METDLRRKRIYQIAVEYPNGVRGTLHLEGYRVIIPDFEEYEFFVHKGHLFYDENWRISEASTGFGFPNKCNAPARQKTINNAIALLREKGKPAFQTAIKEAQKFMTSATPEKTGTG
jgi:hypothetical protein